MAVAVAGGWTAMMGRTRVRLARSPMPLVLAAACVAASVSGGPARAEDDAARRAAMGAILDSVQTVVGASSSLERFSAPENEARVVAALGELGDQGAMLAEHAGARSDEEEFLAGALERYAAWTRRAYERGEYARSLAMLRQLTDICVACHTRQRAAAGSLRAREFVESAELEALSARERARLEVATRQFEQALATLETALPAAPAGDPHLVADLTTYVVVAVRVLGDDTRALALVERMLGRVDLDPGLRTAMEQWAADLRALVDEPPPATLDGADALLARAEARQAALPDAGVVDYVAASEIAQRLVDSVALEPRGFARAYLLLGVSEMRLDPQSWIPRAELHLEQAIRAAPGTPLAERALEHLVERLGTAYESQPGRIPPEVAEHLERLRLLARTGRESP